jgi:hypothetical protein
MKLSGLKAGASIRILAESPEAENLLILMSDSASTYAFIPVLERTGFFAKEDKFLLFYIITMQ